MKSIRFTSKALFVALLSTGLLTPMIKAEGTEVVDADNVVVEQQAPAATEVPAQTATEAAPAETQSPLKDGAKAGMFASAYNWTTGKLGKAYESTKGFVKDNAKAAGIGLGTGAGLTAAVIYGPKAAKKAYNYVKDASWQKRLAIATGAVATTAATVGGLWYFDCLPTAAGTFAAIKSAPSAAYNFVKDNKMQTAVGLGSAVAGSAAVLGANAYFTAEKAEKVENAAGSCKKCIKPVAAQVAAPVAAPVAKTPAKTPVNSNVEFYIITKDGYVAAKPNEKLAGQVKALTGAARAQEGVHFIKAADLPAGAKVVSQ